ncbi:hypothetical protein [Streptomyces barkulensis]|uniref:hypothetical protein n=1 Tax=Streptomyces barkulensis TaxID=1257026 RepID=UPI0011810A36|nr:hypothetical protein [Streptomyces barkulensis]
MQRHGDRAVLGALAEELDLLCLGPAVHLYLCWGEIRSAHTIRAAARPRPKAPSRPGGCRAARSSRPATTSR